MVKRSWLVLVALFLGAAAAYARPPHPSFVRTISGRVTSSVTGDPVVGATVAVVGTSIAVTTSDKGEFTLSAPDGAVTLLIRVIGYKRRTVGVAPDQNTVDVPLEPDVFNLEAVVVTGQATAVEQRNLPNAVTTLAAEQLTRAPTPTLESALQGKIPGALIQANSGAPGGGVQINLRGTTTINAGVDPLIVLDGLIISNDAIPNGMNAVTAAQAGGNPRNQDNAVNRIADLNPADIERVEVLKGASAASIYGQLAANGVIIITTRRGQTGAPRFTVTQRVGTFATAHKLGSRVFKDSAEAVTAFSDSALVGRLCPAATGCPVFDNEEALYGKHEVATETDVSVSGGTEQTRYYVSGLVKRDGGTTENTGYEKQALRANLDQALGSRFQVGVHTQFAHSLAQRGISNNDNTNTSAYVIFPATPSFMDLRPKGPVDNALSYPVNGFAPSNPLQTFALLKNNEDVWRIIGTGNVRFDAITTAQNHLQLSLTPGVDYFTQRNDILSPPDLQYEPQDGFPGTVVLGKSSDLRINVLGAAVHTYTPPAGNQRFTTSLGFQYEHRSLNLTSIVGRDIVSGQENVNLATSVTIPLQREEVVRNVGIFAQEEVLAAGERLLVTGGVRADRSSVNGDPDKFYFFPKGAVSYRFLEPASWLKELKLRFAFGQTGNPPLFGTKTTLDSTGTVQGLFGVIQRSRVGDPNIKPERNTELEGGFDAILGKELATVGFTVYQKTITDMLLEQTVAGSTGREIRIFNGGKLRNRGVEVGVALSPVRRPDVNWILRSTFFLNRSKIVELPVPTFQTGGFSTSLGAFQIEQGKSATQIVGTEGVVGDANPDFQASLSSDLNYHRFSLGFLWDWKQGGDIIDLTELFYDGASNSADWNTAGKQRFATFRTGKTKPYVQSGTYLKLRELTLAYELPTDGTSHLFGGVRFVRFSVSGRNLLRFTPYRGLDPEVSNFGNQAIVRNIDVAPFPPTRSFFFSIDLGF